MTTRYYEETPCEHGRSVPHSWYGSPDVLVEHCPGGSRRELDGVEIVEWSGDETPEDFKLPTRLPVPVSKPGRYAIIPLPEESE